MDPAEPIFHLTTKNHWDEAVAAGTYIRSTVDQTLDEVGFIHCCFRAQIPAILERYWAGRESEVVVLRIDTDRLEPEVKVEGGYPHIYGPLDPAAVTEATPAPR